MDDPLSRFHETFARARAAHPFDATAVSLATATPEGRPSVRVVLLKGVDERGFIFFTNRRSRKGDELSQNPFAAMCFYWASLDEQVRVEGAIEQVPEAESDAYFATRPRESQLSACASLQSETLGSREELILRLRECETQFAGVPVPRPPHWGGYLLVPDRMEFWRAGEFRLHHRDLYEHTASGWAVRHLHP